MMRVRLRLDMGAGHAGDLAFDRLASAVAYARDVELSVHRDVANMNIIIDVSGSSYKDLLIVIHAAVDSQCASMPSIEMDNREFLAFLGEMSLIEGCAPKALVAAISGRGTFMGVPVKLK